MHGFNIIFNSKNDGCDIISGTVLLDTNILIKREDYKIIDKDIQSLMRILNNSEFNVVIHNASFEDINRDKDDERKEIMKSKMNSYSILYSKFDFIKDNKFKNIMKYNNNPNDYVDNALIYSLVNDEVNFLITEDNGIHKKVNRLNNNSFNLQDRVFTVNEAISFFKDYSPIAPYFIEKTTVNYLDINDPIFNKLKNDYKEFIDWFNKVYFENRECLIYRNSDKSLGALLIYKKEKEIIDVGKKKLPLKNRIKISTMVVTSNGYKIGELFLSWIIEYALKNNAEELYLTHYADDEDDPLIYLIEEYGFVCEGSMEDNELVYVKSIKKEEIAKKINECEDNCDFADLSKKYYPYFYDGENVRKFIIPIKDIYHEKLFLSNMQQTSLDKYVENKQHIIEIQKHTIKKAYISKSKTKLNPGDILLFYETSKKGISELGVVEKYYKDLSYEEINNAVGKRSVYSDSELKKYSDENCVILFIYSRRFNKIPPNYLFENNILKGPPQSIQSISDKNYIKLKRMME